MKTKQLEIFQKEKVEINIHDYDIVIVNSSGGKDSMCALWETVRIAKRDNYPFERVVVSHQDLGRIEWDGVKELVKKQADLFGLKTYFSKRRRRDGYEEDLLEHVRRRGMFPSNKQRWCTSDYKMGPGGRIVTALTKDMGECKVLYVFGFRAEESPARRKKPVLEINKYRTTKRRIVHNWLPIHDWSVEKVWQVHREQFLPYHRAYDLGMPRLSCMFCIFAPFDALVISGKENPKLLNEYVEVEKEIGHTFRHNFAIESVQKAIAQGYEPKKVENWKM